jgi:hypothetical protein
MAYSFTSTGMSAKVSDSTSLSMPLTDSSVYAQLTGPSRHTQKVADRLVVRYKLADGSWQAVWSMPLCWDELGTYRRANAYAQWLRDCDGREEVEVRRFSRVT